MARIGGMKLMVRFVAVMCCCLLGLTTVYGAADNVGSDDSKGMFSGLFSGLTTSVFSKNKVKNENKNSERNVEESLFAQVVDDDNNGNGANGRKITICHIPAGNPDNAHEIEILESALSSHLAHGDYVGACDGGDDGDDYECIASDFLNGGFESVLGVLPPKAFGFIGDDKIPGWSTSATDKKIEIWKNGYIGVPAYRGEFFAELNANEVSKLSQSLLVTEGDRVVWSLAHRGRMGEDSMNVKVGPVGDAVLQKVVATNNDSWVTYTGQYVVPDDVKEIELVFEAVDTATGNFAMGNFVDDVKFYVLESEHCDYGGAPDDNGEGGEVNSDEVLIVDQGDAYWSANDGELLTGVYPLMSACGKYRSKYRKFNFWTTQTLDKLESEKLARRGVNYFDCLQYFYQEVQENDLMQELRNDVETVLDSEVDFWEIERARGAKEGVHYIDRETNTVKVGRADGGLVNLNDSGTIVDDPLGNIDNPRPGVHYYNRVDGKFYIGTVNGGVDVIFMEN